MITVTKHGDKVFNGKCTKCGCEFTYELKDLQLGFSYYVFCPDCKEKFIHPNQDVSHDNGDGYTWAKFLAEKGGNL